MRTLLRFAVPALLAAGLCIPFAAAQPARSVLPGHVVEVERNPALVRAMAKRDDRTDVLLTVVLRRTDEAGFQRDLAALYDPASPTYRRWLSPQAIADRYGPSADDYDAVARHFADAGFRIVDGSANRMTMMIAAPRATVERAFDVELVDYDVRTAQGKALPAFANDREPSLPADVAARVLAVNGLATLARARPAMEAWNKFVCWVRAENAGYSSQMSGGATAAGPGTTTPRQACEEEVDKCGQETKLSAAGISDVKKACKKYPGPPGQDAAPDPRPPTAGDAPVAWKHADGSGQKVGITAFSSFDPADVANTLALYGFPDAQAARLARVPVNGGAPLNADQTEVVLDATTVLMGAPGADVVVYDAPFAVGAFQALFNRMIADQVSIITNSWAYCENETSYADVASIDAILATAAAAGITALTGSGDSGSTCLNGAANTSAVPSTSPFVTSVGGTTLKTGPAGTWQSETWWGATGATPPTGQGGFGVSRFFARPSWQAGASASPYRSVPDLAFPADPAEGVSICVAAIGPCPNGLTFGGTSYAAPLLAVAVATMNHAAGTRLGYLNPQIYPLASGGAFHPPAALGTDFAHVGLGRPIANRLYLALTGQAPGPVSATQSIVRAVDARVAANATAFGYVVVKLRDANGNIVVGKTVALSHNGSGAVTVTPPSRAVSALDGAAVFEVRSTSVQNVVFTATDTTDGVVLATTAAVKFDVPPPAAASIQAFPTSVANNGSATTTITVTLQDADGQPTPGKQVVLSQGAGRSVIVAPVAPVTDASGTIQFTATDVHAETVTYTAIVAGDGDLPVPGSAVVTFSGNAPTSCVPSTPPAAAPGYALTPFVTGFKAEAFFFSNVNFGCAGSDNPAFRPDGEVLVGSFRTGALYRMPAQGGAVTSGAAIATHGPTLGTLVYGKDGKLYGARGATGGGFFSGAIYEFDPQTGAIVRTLASGLACVSPLAVDPVSGDLFYTGTCFGAGSDDPGLYRVRNPGGPAPTVVTYATLPGTPNGAVSFSPDGTIYVATKYLDAAPPIVRVAGTNQPQPPAITPITGLASIFWVTVAQTLPDGSARSLIVLGTDNKLKLADLATTPPALTDLTTSGMSSGVIGPDGCLYTNDGETVFRLTQANGTCGFTPTNPAPGISLAPAVTSPDPPQGGNVTLTATLVGMPPQAGVAVAFHVRGANARRAVAVTDANGVATLTYAGIATGDDSVTADAVVGTQQVVSNVARVRWTSGRHAAVLTLNPSVTSGVAGQAVILTAALADGSQSPVGGIAGVTIQFQVAGQSCNAVTSTAGIASCQVTLPLAGSYTLTATFSGNGLFTPSTAAVGFAVLPPAAGPCSAFADVDADSPFCPSVEWIRNRAITVGCLATLYCPGGGVIRLQMAAFMNRLGTAIAGRTLFVAATAGALDPDAGPVVCITDDVATGAYPRRAVADASVSAHASADASFATTVVASVDGGATWTPLAALAHRAYAPAGHWAHVRAGGTADLEAGTSVRFGVQVSRDGLAGTADLDDARCTLRVAVGNR